MVDGAFERAVALVLLLAVASVAWVVVQRRRGALRPEHARGPSARSEATSGSAGVVQASQPRDLTRIEDALGKDASRGERTTVVQFSSEYCSPCKHSARVWRAATSATEGAAFVEIDAGEHIDLVRAFGVLSTPASLVFDATGQLTGRVHGAPSSAQARAALASLEPAGAPA